MSPFDDISGGAVRVAPITGWLVRGIAVLLVVLSGLNAPAAQPKRVLLLHSYGREYAPFNSFSEFFRTEFAQQSEELIDFYDVALESARFEGETVEPPFVAYLESLFADRKPDLVIPVGGPAARFAQRHRDRLFPDTPMLMAATDERHLQPDAFSSNTTAVAVSYDFPQAIEGILQVLPATTNIVVVIGNSPLEKFWFAELQRQFKSFEPGLQFTWLHDLSFAEVQRRVAVLPPRTAILYVVFSVDSEGVPFAEDRALGAIHSAANAPVFGLQESQLGRGIVGGPLMSFEELSHTTVAVAIRILRGEPAGNIRTPVQVSGRPVYDWRELERWGIQEKRLPPGSEVRFRQPTLWERYWWQIGAATAFVAGETLLVIGLLANLARRKQAELRMRELSGRLINAHEDERARVAKDLHDGLSQDLALMAVELDLCGQQPPAEPAQANARMQELSARLREVSVEVHRISHALHPAKLQQLGLAAAIGGFCRELEAGGGIAVSLTCRDVPRTVPEEVALCLYRVTQEALQNVVKHSGAGHATVELRRVGNELRLSIVDDGKGFDCAIQSGLGSLGMIGMRERVRLVGGEIQWASKPGGGTRVDVRVPLPIDMKI